MRIEHTALPALVAALALVVGLAPGALAGPGQVRGSKHDLSTAGGSASRATTETQICVFCHTPHHANPAPQLWNHQASAATYAAYGSSTFESGTVSGTFNTFPGRSAQQPAGSAKLCLSCHDGTIALGATLNDGTIALSGSSFVPATANLGLDLSNDHPVSFLRVAGAAQVVDPPAGDAVRLETGTSYVQCLSCHDPHNQNGDATAGKFLVKTNQRSAICTTCHSKSGSGWSWAASEHSTSAKTYTSANTGGVAGLGAHTGYVTVTDNGCESCHRPHAAPQAQRLLKAVNQRDVCFQCHGSAPLSGTKNLSTAFAKSYRHPLESSTATVLHDDSEVRTSPTNFSGGRRHVVCSDCHNPHAAGGSLHVVGGSNTGSIPANSMLSGVAGVVPPGVALGTGFPMPTAAQTGYGVTASATYEYQICFKCHSSYAYGSAPPAAPSGGIQTDKLSEFNPNNLGYHPVMGAAHFRLGSSSTVLAATLKSPWQNMTPATRMFCSDCHGNNEAVSATVPAGPHGSAGRYLLRFADSAWSTTAPTLISNSGFCANCHDYTALLSETYGRNVHSRSNHRAVPCQSCHSASPHGSFRVGMIALVSDPSPYNLGASRLTSFTPSPVGTNYSKSSCGTSEGAPRCHR
jgi:predicted CXXCH cytochrome family protein